MQIKEARVFNFGKLQKKNYQFSSGINVIYGPNEAGKTTLHTFLLAMLFGMDKNRGRAAAGDVYKRYEPWHAPAFYSGAIRFLVEGRPFYLERNFYYREKRELLRNEADGEELSVAYGDLTMLLGGIGKETFGNTYDVPQCGILDGKELSDILSEYLTDAAESGDGSTHVAKAIAELENKRRKLSTAVRELQEQKQREKRALEIEQELLEKDCRTLHLEIEKEEAELGEWKPEQREWKPEKKEQRHRRRNIIGAMVCLLALFINLGVFLGVGYKTEIFAVVETALTVLFAVTVLLERRQQQEKDLPEAEMVDVSRRQAERILESQRELLLEKETRLYNIAEQLSELSKPGEKERELTENIRALELAAAEIRRLAQEYGEEMADELNAEISRWTSAITGGAYDSVRVDSDGSLKVVADGREIAPEALSRGTLEQFYLAFRIAVGNIVSREETMPLFLDETFCMYDDERMRETLKALAQMEQQIFLFTCQKREQKMLEELGVTYHMINME